MRITTGVCIIFIFIFGFSFALIQVTAEMAKFKTVPEVLDEQIQVEKIVLSQNSYILDRNNQTFSEIYRDENRIYLPYDQIPSSAVSAFISTEDRNFFEHQGFDPPAIFRAFLINAKNNDIEQGASTITQQLVRNYYLNHDQTYNRKLSEVIYAHKIEQLYEKEEILELYINTIFFQNGVYGLEAASRFYFSRPSKELTLAEIAFLCAIPNNPSYYNPLKHSERTKERQEWILAKMLEVQAITPTEYHDAIQTPIQLKTGKKMDRHPDYATYIHEEFKKLVSAEEGFGERLLATDDEAKKNEIRAALEERVNEWYSKGIRIYTALDPVMQNKATEAVSRYLPDQSIQGAVSVVDHSTFELVAITGGKQFQKFDFHRGFQAFRQPGSAIKPLLVYGPYLDKSAVSIKSTINANQYCKNGYCPKNSSGAAHGTVSLETAFKYSYNTPAVRLLERTGIDDAFSYLERFEFAKLQPHDYGLPAAIGGFAYGMSVLEMTNAYTTFANNGTYRPSVGIRKVTDAAGNVLFQWNQPYTAVWSSGTNDKMRKLLTSVVQGGTGKKAYFQSSYIGGKTGTTNDVKDLWFIGLTEEYTAGVWIGKDTPGSLQSIAGKTPHLSIWKKIMNQ